jgi:hypothetical protein
MHTEFQGSTVCGDNDCNSRQDWRVSPVTARGFPALALGEGSTGTLWPFSPRPYVLSGLIEKMGLCPSASKDQDPGFWCPSGE